MPLQHWAHGMYWTGAPEPPATPARGLFTLLGVGPSVLLLAFGLMSLFLTGS